MIKTRWWIGAWLLLTTLHTVALVIGNRGEIELLIPLLGTATSNALLVLTARFVVRILTDAYSIQPTHVCIECRGHVRAEARGHLVVEIGLWMLLLLPGVIYSFWRFSGPRTCPRCGGAALALDSPDARRLPAGSGAQPN